MLHNFWGACGWGGGSQASNGGFLKVDYWQLPIRAVNLPLKTKLMIPAYFPLSDLRCKIVSGSPLNCVGQHVCQFVWVYRSGRNVGQSEKIPKKRLHYSHLSQCVLAAHRNWEVLDPVLVGSGLPISLRLLLPVITFQNTLIV